MTLLAGIFTLFFEIAYQAYVPSLVERAKIIDPNGKLETSRSAARVAGPTIAGIAIAALSAPAAVLGEVIGYLASALSLAAIRRQE